MNLLCLPQPMLDNIVVFHLNIGFCMYIFWFIFLASPFIFAKVPPPSISSLSEQGCSIWSSLLEVLMFLLLPSGARTSPAVPMEKEPC